MAGGTDGQIITYDASGDPVSVGPGSDGEVLTSTGAGSPPAFEAAAGGIAASHSGVCKAWINYDALTQTIENEYNISTVHYLGTGNFHMHLDITMPDAEFIIVTGYSGGFNGMIAYADSTTAIGAQTFTRDGVNTNCDVTSLAVFD